LVTNIIPIQQIKYAEFNLHIEERKGKKGRVTLLSRADFSSSEDF